MINSSTRRRLPGSSSSRHDRRHAARRCGAARRDPAAADPLLPAGRGHRRSRSSSQVPSPRGPSSRPPPTTRSGDCMNLEQAIRGRRTHKQFGSAPVSRRHRGASRPRPLRAEPQADAAVALPRPRPADRRAVAGGCRPEGGTKARARADDRLRQRAAERRPAGRRGGRLSTGVALYIVLLAAHARGLASYWRTPEGDADAGGSRDRRSRRRRALRRADLPRPAVLGAAGEEARTARVPARHPALVSL